jgi:hypothetical protein
LWFLQRLLRPNVSEPRPRRKLQKEKMSTTI